MIEKLRTKLIVASMLSLILVLTVIIGAASVLNYRDITTGADSILSLLKENDGDFPNLMEKKPEQHGGQFSPELPYESRYFTRRTARRAPSTPEKSPR